MLKAKFVRSYVSKKGNDTFVYAVSGTKEALAQYQEDQGENFRADETTGTPLLFTTRFAGPNCPVIKTQNTGRYILDMSELKAQASLAAQFGGNLGQALANAAVAKFMFGGTSAPAPVAKVAEVEEETEEVEEEDLNKI